MLMSDDVTKWAGNLRLTFCSTLDLAMYIHIYNMHFPVAIDTMNSNSMHSWLCTYLAGLLYDKNIINFLGLKFSGLPKFPI